MEAVVSAGRGGGRRGGDYLPRVVEDQGEQALRAQCIPTDPALWKVDRYLDFLAERRKLIAARLNEYLEQGRAVSGAGQGGAA